MDGSEEEPYGSGRRGLYRQSFAVASGEGVCSLPMSRLASAAAWAGSRAGYGAERMRNSRWTTPEPTETPPSSVDRDGGLPQAQEDGDPAALGLRPCRNPGSAQRRDHIRQQISIAGMRQMEMAERKKEQRSEQQSSAFFTDGVRRVDFALVFERGKGSEEEKRTRARRSDFENQLLSEGLELEYDWPEADDPLRLGCVKIHAPWEVLCRCAEMLQMRLPLRPNDVGARDSGALERLLSAPFQLSGEDEALLPPTPAFVTAPFDLSRMDQFLIDEDEEFFTPIQRIRIVWDCLQRAHVNGPQSILNPDGSASSVGSKGKAAKPSSPTESDGAKAKRGIQWLLQDKVYLAAFPLHDGDAEWKECMSGEGCEASAKPCERQVLRRVWARFGRMFKEQPLDAIRRYYGEHVGFYFAWLGFYTQMLTVPSVFGLGCFLWSLWVGPQSELLRETCDATRAPGNVTMCPVCQPPNCEEWALHQSCTATRWAVVFDNASTVLMSVLTVLWASVFQELWKRKEATLAFQWDAGEAEKAEEEVRPEFEARTQAYQINPVTKEPEAYVPVYRKLLLVGGSVSALLFLIMCVVTALFGLVVVRIALYGLFKAWGGVFREQRMDLASWAINGLTFAVVITLGWFYSHAAHRLTEMETPRTQSDYLSSYIWKVFIFEILNNFIPIFYVAFMKGRSLSLPSEQNSLLEMCDPSGCLNEVVATVSILLLFRLVVSNAAELGFPMLKALFNQKRHSAVAAREGQKKLPRWREDFGLSEPELDGVYAEFLEMMVQFGFVTLFIPAFPLLPIICLINNVLEVRLDAVNFVTSYRRPLPMRVSGIKIWNSCINILTKLAVLCNAGIIAFTSDLIPLWVYWYSEERHDTLVQGADGSAGFAMFRLSRFSVGDWGKARAELPPNVTECWYPGYNQPQPPYAPTLHWWKIMTFRLIFFLVYTVTFYYFQARPNWLTIEWLADFLIADVPQEVHLRQERASFLAKKTLYLSSDR